MLFAITSK